MIYTINDSSNLLSPVTDHLLPDEIVEQALYVEQQCVVTECERLNL